jgi:hypothetical protein
MNEDFLRGFAEESKLAGIDPRALRAVAKKALTIGLVGAGAYGGFRALKHFVDTVDNATWFPGRRRKG